MRKYSVIIKEMIEKDRAVAARQPGLLLWRKYMKENDNLAKNIALCKEIEGMVYKVYIHFDESAKEDMKDKIKKLLIKEIS